MPLSGCAVSPESRLETSAWLSTSAHHFATLPRTNGGGLVINTSEEIEPKGLHLIRKLSGLPTFAVGPLTGGRAPSSEDTARDEDSCIKFLDSKPAASVLYVSFGSQNTIPASQMMELERGLEASGRPFIWAVRPPVEFDGTEEFRAEWLPDGFEDRVAAAAQGVVVRRWAPQVAILAHASTGAFLSHCGWNSVLESLWHGVPVVGWPLLADQVFDSRMLEELGVGMEVASGRMFGGLGKGVGAREGRRGDGARRRGEGAGHAAEGGGAEGVGARGCKCQSRRRGEGLLRARHGAPPRWCLRLTMANSGSEHLLFLLSNCSDFPF
ncbi:hypothetical protein PVAP13_9NG751677 [Panicum virgatum]|uniref:UDP-glycosyltransferases domain-containing protein n=1 Tax=Panicum virgatum TaxID=38727 RepID=A0A8T0N3X1_PANVG|nr:hypothetical protein PVAP13_9NG751677 [Panicum virgatum]